MIDQTVRRVARRCVSAPGLERLIGLVVIMVAGSAQPIDDLCQQQAPALEKQGAVVELHGKAS
jgi:hypothetical protein